MGMIPARDANMMKEIYEHNFKEFDSGLSVLKTKITLSDRLQRKRDAKEETKYVLDSISEAQDKLRTAL